ncbi:MAG: DUF4956 domain-containing protein [Solobacterium sp.]|nr:DUF4956 domain-containing protein [Solobacterium sp.]
MFGSVLTNTVNSITIQQFALCFFTSILCGLLIAAAYRSAVNAKKDFLITIALIPAVVMNVIMLVNGNLGIGVAVAGSFSLVRFRSMPGKASDIAVIFLAMAAGLASGMGYVVYALIFTVGVLAAALVLYKVPVLTENQNFRHVRITVSEDMDYVDAFKNVFERYAGTYHLETVKTVNLGAMYQLSYEVVLKNAGEEKQMIDELRIRNGNLPVICSMHAPAAQSL